MLDLVRSDLRRVAKDRLFLVVCILAAGFALVTPLLYMLLFSDMDPLLEEMTAGITMAKGQFFGAFSLGNNFGFIAPFLLVIILCKDFSYGTIRNKIISGHSRTRIFLSMYLTCATVLFCVAAFHAFLTLGIGLLFFPYQSAPFTAGDLGYLFASLGFELLLYFCVAAILSWLCATMKNVGLVIVLYAAISLGLTMVATILQVGISILEMEAGNETLVKVLTFLQNINIFNFYATIGTGTSYEIKQILHLTLVPAIGSAALLGLGILKFRRKDLK